MMQLQGTINDSEIITRRGYDHCSHCHFSGTLNIEVEVSYDEQGDIIEEVPVRALCARCEDQ